MSREAHITELPFFKTSLSRVGLIEASLVGHHTEVKHGA